MIIANSANFKPVDLSRIQSINMDVPAEGLSNRYGFISTMKPVEVFQSRGWYPSKVTETFVRMPNRQGYQKHMIRFRQPNGPLVVGETIPEAILTNSHDGTASFILMVGFFTVLCGNGMIRPNGQGIELKVRHLGYTDQKVNDCLDHITGMMPKMIEQVEEFNEIEMSPDEQGRFAMAGLKIKYGAAYEDLVQNRTFNPSMIARPIRHSELEKPPTLWRTLNTVQEKMLRPGLMSYTQEVEKTDWRGRNYTSTKRRRARGVTAINETIRINQKLWEYAAGYADGLKGRVPENLPAVVTANVNV